MPAMLDDPTATVIYRTSGDEPHPTASSELPREIIPRQVTLRDRVTQATLVPFSAAIQVPRTLVAYLCSQLNKEIEKGDTYPMTDLMTVDAFGAYWFANFGAVMLLGDIQEPYEVMQMAQSGCDWEKECLGSFYIKPNYPGRSSHVCNGGFLVTDGSRNRGVGRLMGEGYLDYAPKLGYTYSVFNLVYETNTPSCRIWDALGFKRIGRVKGCGNLKSYPGQLIDAIIFGRDLGVDEQDIVSEERFERIKFYLKHQRYPDGADRAEKSRLRSASTHYKLVPAAENEPEKLMLKGKEVISDPQKQYDVAWRIHSEHHGGINKTTAVITERYHWVRIKDTVTQVIKNCTHCKEASQRALAPYGRKEPVAQKTVIPPFEREFSVPPGERSLRTHGYASEDMGLDPVAATTPGDTGEDDADAEAAPEDATFGALIASADAMMPSFSEFPQDDNSVPVDPDILNGVDAPPNFHHIEQEVRRLQKTQTFGNPLFAPQQMQALPGAEGSLVAKRSSRKATAEFRPTSSDQEQQSGIEAHTPPSQGRGTKRKPSDTTDVIGSAELKRVTRRGAPTVTTQAGHVSEDAWRRQLSEQGRNGG